MGDQHKMFSDIVHLQTLSSCVGNCSDGLPVQFGIASFNDADASKAWLSDSNNGAAVDLTGSDQGAYSDSAINTYWSDTTNMDNLRGADITGDIAVRLRPSVTTWTTRPPTMPRSPSRTTRSPLLKPLSCKCAVPSHWRGQGDLRAQSGLPSVHEKLV